MQRAMLLWAALGLAWISWLSGAVPVSFVVRADATQADEAAFATLARLVALADLRHVPLTTHFTAQWAELILVEPGPGELAEIQVATGDDVLFAVVEHVSDYTKHPLAFARWSDVLVAADAEGGGEPRWGTR